MYLLTSDFMTIWKLAHHWAGYEDREFLVAELPDDLKTVLYRIMQGVLRNELNARTRNGLIFSDQSFLGFFLEIRHYFKIFKCIKRGVFDKDYLNSLYIKRPDLLRWCESDYLIPPKCWQPELQQPINTEYDDSDDENESWLKT